MKLMEAAHSIILFFSNTEYSSILVLNASVELNVCFYLERVRQFENFKWVHLENFINDIPKTVSQDLKLHTKVEIVGAVVMTSISSFFI